MCAANKRFILYLSFALLFVSVAGALRAEEPGPWYLISETELLRLETISITWEQDRQSWLSQVKNLKSESENSNDLLRQERETTLILRRSYETSEAEKLTLLSSKNGEIADQKQVAADKTLEAEKYKGMAGVRLVVIIALAGAWIIFIGFKVCRFFRLI